MNPDVFALALLSGMKKKTGFYAGYIASSFTFGRFLTAYIWGNAADKIGRKPVVMIGLSSIVACSIAFGLSTNFAVAVTSRCVLTPQYDADAGV